MPKPTIRNSGPKMSEPPAWRVTPDDLEEIQYQAERPDATEQAKQDWELVQSVLRRQRSTNAAPAASPATRSSNN